jgi:quercetin dioxygenase-like cupin family protein
MEIRRFGPGHRRPEGPPGSQGVTGQVIHSDSRGVVSELAFRPNAVIAPHANPNTAFFIVISGGGFVQVGADRSRVNQGEAVVWPAGEPHGAYTEHGEMRAIVVEFAGADDALTGGPIPVASGELPGRGGDDAAQPVDRTASGALAPRQIRRDEHDESHGEPW